MFQAHHHNLRNKIAAPVNPQLAPGSYVARLDAENLASGVYLCTLAAEKLFGDEKDEAGPITIIA